MGLCVAIAGFLAALRDTNNTERSDWVGLRGTVVDNGLKSQDDEIYGGNVQALLTIEADSGSTVQTRVPLSLYREARIGGWVEGSKTTLKLYSRSRPVTISEASLREH